MEAEEVRVVVVDDVADEAEAVAAALELDGYHVRIARDGLSALAMIEAYQPQCVLLDIGMPGLNGCQVARQLRDRHGDEMVVIAVSGWGEQDQRLSRDFDCIDHYLRKPFDPESLRKLLPPLHH